MNCTTSNKNVPTFTLNSFPTKQQMIAQRKDKYTSELLKLIYDKIMNSNPVVGTSVNTVSVSKEELLRFDKEIYEEVFRDLMVSKEFNVMRVERDNGNFSYNISW